MNIQDNFQRHWPETKKQLHKLSQDALSLINKAEKELIRFSKEGKKQLDKTTMVLKQEHLFYLIGKEYVKDKFPSVPNPKMKELIADLNKVQREIMALTNKKGRVKRNGTPEPVTTENT